MPTIYDNIESKLLEGLRSVLPEAVACSFCVGYLNLRGWAQLADAIEHLQGGDEAHACRVLVGMHRPPEEEMRLLYRASRKPSTLDGPTRSLLRRRIIESFKHQLEFGVPSNEAERALQRLAEQLRARKVLIKAFLRYPLHAKLYLVKRPDPITPLVGFVGSSNLTLAGLSQQGELNVDVVEQDAAHKLQQWFDERWNDPLAIDLTEELAQLIENSWARKELIRPYLIYLKIAYHLSEDARQGEREFKVPAIFRDVLLDFQKAAVSLAARKLHRHGGVLLGDVVGLGKTLMATAIARIMQEDNGDDTLVICPPKLVPMWERHLQEYKIVGHVLSLGRVIEELPNLPRYRLVIIDESHNLRNREAKRYKAIRDYIERNESRVILLTATPYNKQYTDISNQLRLFLDEDQDLHVRPERYFQWLKQERGETENDFIARFQTSPHSLRAFEQSPFPEDWQDLMRLFLVRRTRRFIIQHYAKFDEERRRYYVWLNGQPQYFPLRQPKRVEFPIDESNPNDQYARLFRDEVVEVIENLELPRYGLANYLIPNAEQNASSEEKRILGNLSRAGKRLIGFCRTNLFKRLESSGYSFLLSVERHIVRNLVTLYALENGLPIPIGTQDAAMLDTAVNDADEEFVDTTDAENSAEQAEALEAAPTGKGDWNDYAKRAERLYDLYRTQYHDRFYWLHPRFFRPELKEALRSDAEALLHVLERAGEWNPASDAKLQALYELVAQRHRNEKVLIFTQFADTALYLHEQLRARGVEDIAVVTNQKGDPEELARRFSPSTNGGLRSGETELRVLIATDVLAEGQNLQDAHIVVNYDLPWAIVRLIQRAGRVDRIGQKHDTILVYSFLPAEGVERIIRLRQRLTHRLQQNQEVIGTDESFFGEEAAARLRDLYTEKAGTLDEEGADEDIDLASLALQVWNSASTEDQKAALELPPIVSATRALSETEVGAHNPPGVVTYLRYPDGTDALIRVDEQGNLVSQSLSAIFRTIACSPDTPALERAENHHELVARCVQIATKEQETSGGQLGSLRSIRRKLWERLNQYRQSLAHPKGHGMPCPDPQHPHGTPCPDPQHPRHGTPSPDPQHPRHSTPCPDPQQQLDAVLNLIWRYPLKSSAQEAISRQMRLGISDSDLLNLVARRAEEGSLCEVPKEETSEPPEPQIICSLGLVKPGEKP
jgi:superfamily II DNA or RNA helicase